MGNSFKKCRQKSESLEDVGETGVKKRVENKVTEQGKAAAVVEPSISLSEDISTTLPPVQHISERQDPQGPNDIPLMPNAPRKKSGLIAAPGQPSGRRRSFAQVVAADTHVLKSNSTSTLFVKSTVSQPDLQDTLKCVALATYFNAKAGHETKEPKFDDIFNEALHPLTLNGHHDFFDAPCPSEESIYNFIKTLFQAAALTAECSIITLVYIERLLGLTGLTMHASNWRRIVLGAILLASKVWDDQAVWNVDFCTILPDIPVADMNDLERSFLEKLQFNVSVPASTYARYYFELRELAAEEKGVKLQPLDVATAQKLEAMTTVSEELAKGSGGLRRVTSLEPFVSKSPAAILN
eukprot:Colp12_sorted_trinity150504_noHs@36320